MVHIGANKKKRKSSRSNSRKSSHGSRTATLQEIQEMTSLIDQHDWTGDNRANMTDWASASQPASKSRSMGLGKAIHSPLVNHDRIYEGPRYCLLLRANEIMYGWTKIWK